MRNVFVTGTLVLIVAFAAMALAADPVVEPQDSGAAGRGEPNNGRVGRAGTPQLDVNKAEMLEQGIDVDAANEERPVLNPLMGDINAVLDEARLRVEELQTRIDQEPNAEAALALTRQVEKIKQEAELQILRLQADHARGIGEETTANEIEQAITIMTAPRTVGQPVDRPAPPAAQR